MQDLESGATAVIRGGRWRVERTVRCGDLLRVDAVSLERRRLPRRATFLAPFDHLSCERAGRPVRVSPRRALLRVARRLAERDLAGLPIAACAARIEVLPHQLEPVLAVLAGARRLLLADAVGLGKTIEAGLVLAELHRRRALLHALVLVPAGVSEQWTDELSGRFGLPVHRGDAATLARACGRLARGVNPWAEPGVWVASLDYVKQRHVLDGLPHLVWDALLVDEAHLACGDSERRRAVQAVAERARRVLLITATPDSGDAEARRALQALGILRGVPDPLLTIRHTRRDLGWPERRCVRLALVRPSAAERRLLDALVDFERLVLARAWRDERDGAILLLSVLRKRALSSAAALAATLERRLEWLRSGLPPDEWRQTALAFGDADDEVGAETARALTAATGLAGRDEVDRLDALRALAAAAAREPTKARRLVRLIARAREPVVVFTEFRDSLALLASTLAECASIAAIHGGLTPAEQRRALATFHATARVLVATDVAAHGLNLQDRARWVVHFDVPWNPVRLEQRAGRVDRIGQTRPVHVTVLGLDHVTERQLLARVRRRADAAAEALGDADAFRQAVPELRDAARPSPSVSPRAPAAPHDRGLHARARRMAAVLTGRRRLLVDARGQPSDGRPFRADARLAPRLVPRGRSLFIFAVPIVDASGGAMEHHSVAVRAGADDESRAAEVAAACLARRARALGVVWRAIAARDAGRERALTDALRARLAHGPLQPGLFDARAVRLAARHADIDAEIDARLEARIAWLRDRLAPEVGRPRLIGRFD